MKKYISLIGFLFCVAMILHKDRLLFRILKEIQKWWLSKTRNWINLSMTTSKRKMKVVHIRTGLSGAGVFQQCAKNSQRSSLCHQRRLRSAFPEHGVYRIYASPFWKVRIGDFRTIEDARAFRAELVKLFPEYSRETYTVRESKITIR